MKIMRRFISTISILILALTYTGCHNNALDIDNPNPFNDVDDNTTIASEYGHTPYDAPEDFTFYYQDSVLNIPYTFYGGRVKSEVGLFIFIDGIVQPYSINDSEDGIYDYMKIFRIDANSVETYMLNITPNCGKKGDILKLNFVCIDFPTTNTLDESSLELQSMSTTISWKLSFLQDVNGLTLPLQKELMIKTISNTIENNYSDTSEFDSSLEELDTAFDDTNKTLRFIAYTGKNEGCYRTTIFMDNKPAIIDGDKSFIEHIINKDEKLTYMFKIADINLNDTNIFYAVSIRLDNEIDNWQQQLDVFKTNSVLTNK